MSIKRFGFIFFIVLAITLIGSRLSGLDGPEALGSALGTTLALMVIFVGMVVMIILGLLLVRLLIFCANGE